MTNSWFSSVLPFASTLWTYIKKIIGIKFQLHYIVAITLVASLLKIIFLDAFLIKGKFHKISFTKSIDKPCDMLTSVNMRWERRLP